MFHEYTVQGVLYSTVQTARLLHPGARSQEIKKRAMAVSWTFFKVSEKLLTGPCKTLEKKQVNYPS